MISLVRMDEDLTVYLTDQSRGSPAGFMAHYFLSVRIEAVRAMGIASRPGYL